VTQLRAAVRSSFICHRMWDKKSVSGSGIFEEIPPCWWWWWCGISPAVRIRKSSRGLLLALGWTSKMADDDDYQLEPPPLSAWAATVGMWTGPIGETAVNSSSTIPFQSVIFTTADRLEIYTVSNSLARRRRLTSQSKLPKNVWGFQPDPPYRQLARPTRYTPSAAILLSSFNYL
jgi:hypothetical protein